MKSGLHARQETTAALYVHCVSAASLPRFAKTAKGSATGGERGASPSTKVLQNTARTARDNERMRMNTIENLITNHPFALGMKPEHVAELARGAEEREFETGDILFRVGEPADRLFLIVSGSVELANGRDGKCAGDALRAGDVLGWSWLFPPFSWHFTARAAAPTRVIVCNGGHLLVTAEENAAFGYELMKRVAHVVIRRMEGLKGKPVSREMAAADY
jgi:CRP/FNR family transcriptional regulator, cyclic AMP receptor protein